MLDVRDSINKTLTKRGGLNPRTKYAEMEWIRRVYDFTDFLKNVSLNERLYCVFNNITQKQYCDSCNTNETKFISFVYGYRRFCSPKCGSIATREYVKNKVDYGQVHEKCRQTNLEKYGVENPFQREDVKDKIRQTKLDRYGNEHYTKTDEYMEKSKHTNRRKYGEDWSSQSEYVKSKITQTNLERYGTACVLSCDKIKKKIAETNLRKYGSPTHVNAHIDVDKLNDRDWLHTQHKTNRRTLEHISVEINCTPVVISRKMKEFDISIEKGMKSKEERIICDFLDEIGIEYQSNVRIFENSRKEIDIYIPTKKLCIEVNGLFWHSDLNGKDKKYHLNKTTHCTEKNLSLLHLWDYEIRDNIDIIKSMLLYKFNKIDSKFYARQCCVKEVDSVSAKSFLDDNHIQGYVKGRHIGLYEKDTLVSVLSWGEPRFSKKYDWEILRFAVKKYHSVVGGFSKLLKHIPNGKIVSYADIRYSNGNLYNKTGFKLSHISTPSYFYIRNNKKIGSRTKFQKHKIKKLVETFDDSLSEWGNMKLNGYDRVWDCGNMVYVLDKESE